MIEKRHGRIVWLAFCLPGSDGGRHRRRARTARLPAAVLPGQNGSARLARRPRRVAPGERPASVATAPRAYPGQHAAGDGSVARRDPESAARRSGSPDREARQAHAAEDHLRGRQGRSRARLPADSPRASRPSARHALPARNRGKPRANRGPGSRLSALHPGTGRARLRDDRPRLSAAWATTRPTPPRWAMSAER